MKKSEAARRQEERRLSEADQNNRTGRGQQRERERERLVEALAGKLYEKIAEAEK